MKQWDKALADFSKAVEVAPNQMFIWHSRTLAYLGAGDTKGYREGCATMVERFGQTEDARTASWVAWTCALGPGGVQDLEEAVKLAERAVERDAANERHVGTLGAALYRAGRFDEAVEQLSQLTDSWEKGRGFPYGTSPAYTWFFLTMAHHQLGDSDEAKSWFDKAVERAEKEIAGDASWNRKLTLQLLRAEAESMIKGEETEDRGQKSEVR
jgi:tetratricopeptide (TPR) repeat protein